MAAKKRYLPNKDAERVIWLNNFAAKVGGYATLFGISPTEVSMIGDMAKHYEYVVSYIAMQKQFAKQLVAYKNTLSVAKWGATLGQMPKLTPPTAPATTPAGIFTFIGGVAQRIKSNTANYTESIGSNLGIVGTETVFKKDDYIPKVSAKTKPGMVVVKFSKKDIEGVNVYSLPVGSTDQNVWVKLGFDGHPPYFDKRPLAVAGQPEMRYYKIVGVIDDVEIGNWSNVASVVFGG